MGTPVQMRPLVDRILSGRLTEVLTAARREGLSYERIARRLGSDHNIDITGEQVRKWCIESNVDAVLEAQPQDAA